ncbi:MULTISPECIES: phage holin family protein [Clostridium]|uniref:Phage holin family protein n=1 Tax=Clostridium senegalense TaxID=1465809 RepID=A0A6M0GXV9_9CLOT|nr:MULTISPECIES: phage holin family protein [Clostridium]NEU03436.1 phage holin family protein [Clostridium senegalense]
MSENENKNKYENKSSFLGWIVRLVLFAIVLGVTSFLTPGFTVNGLWSMIIAAVVITVLDYFVEALMGVDASPFGKGFKGFAIAAVIIYLAQFVVPNMRVSIIGALIAAIIIGIIDAIFPGRVM